VHPVASNVRRRDVRIEQVLSAGGGVRLRLERVRVEQDDVGRLTNSHPCPYTL